MNGQKVLQIDPKGLLRVFEGKNKVKKKQSLCTLAPES